MGLEGNATSGSVLRGKITNHIVDKTLSVPGACAEAKTTGEMIAKSYKDMEALAANTETTLTAQLTEEIETKTAGMNESIIGLSDELAVERSRINNLSTLEEGSTTGDAELIDARVGYLGNTFASAGNAVRGQIKHLLDKMVLQNQIMQENAFYERVSNGHFYRIPADKSCLCNMWIENKSTGAYELGTSTSDPAMPPWYGSDFIKAPKYLGVRMLKSSSTFYIFFYNLVDGQYVVRWDCICKERDSRKMNYINYDIAEGDKFLYEIPDGAYMQIVDPYDVEFYGWDGEPCGFPVSSDAAIISTASATGALHKYGTGGITIPGSAKAYFCKNGAAVHCLHGVKNGVNTQLLMKTHRFYALPEGYDFFRVRFYPYYVTTTNYAKQTLTGDISDYIAVICDAEATIPVTRAMKVIENAKALNAITWTPAVNVTVATDKTFKAGVTYNGHPYGSNWLKAHYVGWHVSPHTFVNAINDESSIFYSEQVSENAPFYSNVCSTFATLAAGWPYPQNNEGFVTDPNVSCFHSPTPVVGAVWSDVYNHCVVPERVDKMADGRYAVTAYESVRPLSMRTTRYSFIDDKSDLSVFGSNKDYYDGYGLAATHVDATGDLTHLPWCDLSDTTIVNGSARPYKGDKCVYTSAESVLINIKNTSAKLLYLEDENGNVQSISINNTRMDVSDKLNKSGIYYVYTDADSKKESFEYVVVTPVSYKITNGVISFKSNDFWYAWCDMAGTRANVPSNSKGNYSEWSETFKMEDCLAIFYKGTYGAYTVPVTREV